jgi:hypothetical protein
MPRLFLFLVPVLAIAAALFPTPVFSGNADLWRSQSIYQVVLF